MDNVNTYKVNEEAVKKIAERVYDNGSTVINRNDLEEMFPELKESEDEEIRKGAITSIKRFIEYTEEEDGAPDIKEMLIRNAKRQIAWLEKQDKQEVNDNEDILQRFSFYSYKDEPNILYLSGLYVNEEYRNKGIGTKILEVANEVAKSLDCYAIRLKTKKDSDAERLYRTHGYNSLATEDKDEIWLEKQGEQKPIEWSEQDERISKNIISWLKNIEGQTIPINDYNSAIAWLERQSKHANFINKIQIGDKVTRNEDGVLVNLSQLERVAKPNESKQGEQKPAWSEDDEQTFIESVEALEDFGKFELADWLKEHKNKFLKP